MKKISDNSTDCDTDNRLLRGQRRVYFIPEVQNHQKEQVDQASGIGPAGTRVAVFLNSEREESVKGRYIDGQVYLPVNWVDRGS